MGEPQPKVAIGPSSASMHGVRVFRSTSSLAGLRALSSHSCALCKEPARSSLPIIAALSLPLMLATCLALPLVLAAAIRVLWGARDLFGVMAERAPFSVRGWVLLCTPVLVPAVVFLLSTVVGLVRPAVRVPSCGRCRRSSRLSAWRWRGLSWLTFVLWAALLMAWTGGPAVHSPVAGALFVPLALAWVALERRSVRGPLRATVRGDAVLWSGDGAAALALSQVAPFERASLPRWSLGQLLWVTPLLVLVPLTLIAPLEPLDQPCTWGAYPLSYRSGVARTYGCKLPNGLRHGVWHGDVGAWSSSSSMGYDAPFLFGEWHGDAELRNEVDGGLIARGHVRMGDHVGQWRVTNTRGEELEALDVSARKVLRSTLLACPAGSDFVLEGQPHWGARICKARDPGVDGEYYEVRDLRLVERGVLKDGQRVPNASLAR